MTEKHPRGRGEMAKSQDTIKIQPAFLVVDAQNCFMARDGSYDKMGFPIESYREIIEPLKTAIEEMRNFEVPIFFSKAIREASGIDLLSQVHKILPLKREERIRERPLSIRGTWDSELINEVEIPPAKEHIVEKRRDSVFQGTELAIWLDALGVDTLIFAGVDTAICVESTLRDAFNIGYDVILLSDATASLRKDFYQTTLEEVRENFGLVVTVQDLFKRFKKQDDGYAFLLK